MTSKFGPNLAGLLSSRDFDWHCFGNNKAARKDTNIYIRL